MLMSDALLAVREQLDETTATAWEDPTLRRWINEAVADLARRTEYYDTWNTIAITGGDAETLATGLPIIRVHRVEWWTDIDGTAVIPLEIREGFALDPVWFGKQMQTQGVPAFCSIKGVPPGLTFQLYPIPASDGELKIYYSGVPAPLAVDGSEDASGLSVPSGWDDLIIYYAQWCAERRDALPAWTDSRGLYEAKVQDMLSRVAPYHSANGVITDDAGDWGFEYM